MLCGSMYETDALFGMFCCCVSNATYSPYPPPPPRRTRPLRARPLISMVPGPPLGAPSGVAKAKSALWPHCAPLAGAAGLARSAPRLAPSFLLALPGWPIQCLRPMAGALSPPFAASWARAPDSFLLGGGGG